MQSSLPYTRLNWRHKGYQNFEITRHRAAGDGHCMLHAICYAISVDYRNAEINGKRVSRNTMMKQLREDIAASLDITDPKTRLTLYESINDGNLKILGDNYPYYSRDGLQALLRSNRFLGQELILIFEKIFDKTIYILDEDSEDVYVMEDIPPERKSIVIYYSRAKSHFDAISVRDPLTGKQNTHFHPSNPFIKHLRLRLTTIKP